MPDLLYVDTSAVLDRALGQKHHRRIASALRDHSRDDGRLVASRIMHLEARRAYVRERLRGFDAGSIVDLAAQITPLPVTEDVWGQAHALDRHVTTLDAIHLATCKLVDATLLSTDSLMLTAAGDIGITVHDASWT